MPISTEASRASRAISIATATGGSTLPSPAPSFTGLGRLRLPRAPALVIGLAREARVGRGRHAHAHLALAVPLHHGLARAAVLLAPHQHQLVAHVDAGIDDAEREAAALVVAVAREHGEA